MLHEVSEVNVDFRLRVKIPAGYLVCIVGSSPALGSWDPLNAKVMRRSKLSDQDWHKEVKFKRQELSVRYRFFICKRLTDDHHQHTSKESLNSDIPRPVGAIIYKWEPQTDSRSLNFSELTPINILPIVDTGWTIDHHQVWASKWLVNVTELRLRFVGDTSVRFFNFDSNYEVRGIRCCPINCKEVMRNVNSEHSCPGPVVTNDAKLARLLAISGVPVSAFRKLIGPGGIPQCPEYQSQHLCALTDISVFRLSQAGSYEHISQQQHIVPFNAEQFFTYHVCTTTPETLGLRFEFYRERRGSHVFFATAFVLPFEKERSFKQLRTPIFGLDTSCLGELTIDCLIVKPFAEKTLGMKVSHQHYWQNRGNHGTGSVVKDAYYYQGISKILSVEENTMASIKAGSLRDVNYIEFSVQLCKDKVPVIYQDFHVLISSYNKACKAAEVYEIAVKDLTLAKLQSAKLNKYSNLACSLPADYMDYTDLQPFPTLASVLRFAAPRMGFIIVVKYPQPLENGVMEIGNYFDHNTAIDAILANVEKNNSARNTIFSSSHADTCIMLQQKQNRFPVVFRCLARDSKNVSYSDFRSKSLEMAVCFAASEKLLGVELPAEDLIKDLEVIRRAHSLGLVVFVWSDSLDINRKGYRSHVDAYVCEHIPFNLDQDLRREVFHLSKRKEDTDIPKAHVMTGLKR